MSPFLLIKTICHPKDWVTAIDVEGNIVKESMSNLHNCYDRHLRNA